MIDGRVVCHWRPRGSPTLRRPPTIVRAGRVALCGSPDLYAGQRLGWATDLQTPKRYTQGPAPLIERTRQHGLKAQKSAYTIRTVWRQPGPHQSEAGADEPRASGSRSGPGPPSHSFIPRSPTHLPREGGPHTPPPFNAQAQPTRASTIPTHNCPTRLVSSSARPLSSAPQPHHQRERWPPSRWPAPACAPAAPPLPARPPARWPPRRCPARAWPAPLPPRTDPRPPRRPPARPFSSAARRTPTPR